MKVIRLIAVVALAIVGISLVLERGTGLHAKAEMTSALRVGTLNGKPLFVPKRNSEAAFASRHDRPPSNSPADEQEVAAIATKQLCESIKSEIQVAARNAGLKELHISVSQDEVANKMAKVQHDPDWGIETQRKQWIANNLAATEVFDEHQDPEKVFETLILPMWKGMPREQAHRAWEYNLVAWSTPEARMKLAKMAAAASANKWNTEQVEKGSAKSFEHMLVDEKLDQAVIAKLAAQDPQFRADLKENPLWPGEQLNTPGLLYMGRKIEEFWKSRYGQQQITLNYPKLADECQLADFGVKVGNK
jgi:hypothetical protein